MLRGTPTSCTTTSGYEIRGETGITAKSMKGTHMKTAFFAAVAALLAFGPTASAEISGDVVKIGVLNDMSSLYADITGAGLVEAARMAIADFGGTMNGKKIQLISPDHQNKPYVGSAIATQWFDNDGVDVIVDVP